MKGIKIYDANARKRDDEEFKLEKMKTVDKYFDKWSKITSRCSICVKKHIKKLNFLLNKFLY